MKRPYHRLQIVLSEGSDPPSRLDYTITNEAFSLEEKREVKFDWDAGAVDPTRVLPGTRDVTLSAKGVRKTPPKWACPECGGVKVQCEVWVNCNTDEIGESDPDKDIWCEDCAKEIGPRLLDLEDKDEREEAEHLQREAAAKKEKQP